MADHRPDTGGTARSQNCSEKVEPSAFIEVYLQHFSDHGRVAFYMDQHIVGEPGCNIAVVPDIDLFSKGFHSPPGQMLSAAVGSLLDSFEDAVEHPALVLFRNLVGHFCGRCTGAPGIDESKGVVEAHAAHDVDRVVDVRVFFTGESDDNICRDGDVRDPVADLLCQRDVLFFCIVPVHPFEDPVGT